MGLLAVDNPAERAPVEYSTGVSPRLRTACRLVCILIALGQMWTMRFVMSPDGTAYVDIAKAWTRGDWAAAINSYWSPLYSWLLAAAIAIFRPGIETGILVTHMVCAVGFFCALAAWEFLLREWERWQGPPANRALIEIAGYCTILWGGLHMIETAYNSADVYVIALLLAAAALTVRVRRRAANWGTLVWLGLALGLGYLAKAAFLVVIPVWLVTLGFMRVPARLLALAAMCAAAVCLPFIAALSISTGRFTAGDAGALNYTWLVNGVSVRDYKDNVNPPPTEARRIQTVLEDPRVVSFESHPVGTMPLHNNPAWWCLGYRPHFDIARQWMVLRTDFAPMIVSFAGCPALWLALAFVCTGHRRSMLRTARAVWFLLPGATVLIAGYWAVMVLPRYLAAPFTLLGFVMLASVWRIPPPEWLRRNAPRLLPIGLAAVMCVDLSIVVFFLAGEALGKCDLPDKSNVRIARSMARNGVRPGDRIGYIGDAQEAAWVGLDGARVIAEVPGSLWQDDDTFGRPMQRRFDTSDRFWQASPERRQQVLEAFRHAGARWVCADSVPLRANTDGWNRAAETRVWRGGDSPFVYYRNLNEAVRSSR